MTPPSTELATLVEAVRSGHEGLDGTVVELRRLCGEMRSSPPRAPDAVEALARFAEELLVHFAEEELEETFGSLLTDQPQFLHRVDRLQQEHVELTEAATRLVGLARSGSGLVLAASIERILDALSAHEHAENALMQELILLDEGAAGD